MTQIKPNEPQNSPQVHYLEAYPREQSRNEHSTAQQTPCPSLWAETKIAKAAEKYKAEYRRSRVLHNIQFSES